MRSAIASIQASPRLRNSLIRRDYRLTLLYDDPTADDEGGDGGNNLVPSLAGHKG